MPTRPITGPLSRSLSGGVTGVGAVGAWLPTSAASLKAWWEINDTSTLFTTSAGTTPATVGGVVGRIEDKSGNGKHITFADANRPILRQDANGKHYLEGDGTARYGTVPGSANYFKFLHDGTGATTVTVAALEDAAAADATRYVWHTNGVTTTLAGMGLNLATVAGVASTIVRVGNGAASVISAGSTAGDLRADGKPAAVICTFRSQTGADFRHYLDGAQSSASGFSEANTPSSGDANNAFTLFTSNASAYFRGKFYALAIFAEEFADAPRKSLGRYALRVMASDSYTLGVGDSHTYNNSYGQYRLDFHPARLEALLRAGGVRRTSVNKGISGDTTLRIITRLSNVTEAGYGDLAVIYAGTNDLLGNSTVQASPAPTASVFAVAAGKGAYYSAGGQITVNGEAATVQSVATDTITLSAPLSFTPTAGQAVVIDTRTNLVTIGNALKAAGYSRLIIGGQHYLNFASGGDTAATPLASNVSLRALQSGAASDLGALYVDFHAYMRDLIVAGTYTQGNDTAWHVAVGNTHLNNTGEQILADAIFAAMQAQGWA